MKFEIHIDEAEARDWVQWQKNTNNYSHGVTRQIATQVMVQLPYVPQVGDQVTVMEKADETLVWRVAFLVSQNDDSFVTTANRGAKVGAWYSKDLYELRKAR